MSMVEIKCSYCQSSFNEAEGTCPYCGRTIAQIKREKEEQSKMLSSLQEQIDACRPNRKAAEELKEVLPLVKEAITQGTRIENQLNTHHQENLTHFQSLEGKLDDYQKALLENMKEMLAAEEGIDSSVKAYFEKAIPLREKEGPDASEKVGGKTIYASPIKHLERMKEGEAAPFSEFFNCVGFELRNRMEAALKRLGVPAFEDNKIPFFKLSEAKDELKKDRDNPNFQFPMALSENPNARQIQEAAYWRIRESTIQRAGRDNYQKPPKGLQGSPKDRFLCVLGDKDKANSLSQEWRACNLYVHGADCCAPLPSEQLSGAKAENRRKELLASISAINNSGLLGEEKL